MNIINNIKDIGSWWSQPQFIQDWVKSIIPNKDTWTLNITKKSDWWYFSIPQFFTIDEALCGGTEKAIDWHFKKKFNRESIKGDKMKMTVTTVKPDSFDAWIIFQSDDPCWADASEYFDVISGIKCWLCPYVQVLFKKKPQEMWLTFN